METYKLVSVKATHSTLSYDEIMDYLRAECEELQFLSSGENEVWNTYEKGQVSLLIIEEYIKLHEEDFKSYVGEVNAKKQQMRRGDKK